ncbi:MAG TPA: hypothetical protein VGM78_12105, partial [Ilumatobacteraceae bacterium]
ADLWAQLEPLLVAYNAQPSHRKIKPVLIEIDNDEHGGLSLAPNGTRTGEFWRPLQALVTSHATRDADIETQLLESFDSFGGTSRPESAAAAAAIRVRLTMYEHPGRTMPLGWTLSENSLDDLPHQLALTCNVIALTTFSMAFGSTTTAPAIPDGANCFG